MSKSIQAFALKVEPAQQVSIPFGSELLGIEDLKSGPVLWAIVPNDTSPVQREIIIYDTAKELHVRCNRTNYLGRFTIEKKTLHVFDVT
jgi:hypothetical protein